MKPLLMFLLMPALALGCVRRVVDISSDPDGAVVWVNDREVGATPVEVDFIHYGEFDVQVFKPGYEPITSSAKASAPVWDFLGLDLLAEILPVDLVSRNSWHFALEAEEGDADALEARAVSLRNRLIEEESAAE